MFTMWVHLFVWWHCINPYVLCVSPVVMFFISRKWIRSIILLCLLLSTYDMTVALVMGLSWCFVSSILICQ